MKKTYVYPALAVLAGAVGCALRRRALNEDFDEMNLPVPGLATHLLIGLTIGCFLVFGVLAFLLSRRKNWSDTMTAAPLPALKGSAALYLLSAAAFFVQQRTAQSSSAILPAAGLILPVLMLIGSLAAAVGLWMLSRNNTPNPIFPMLPAFCGCFWMMNSYHSYANDPVVLHFVWFILAVLASTLGWYELSGLALNRGNTRRLMLLCLLTVVLSMIALAGGEGISDQLLLGAQVISFLTVSLRLAANLE